MKSSKLSVHSHDYSAFVFSPISPYREFYKLLQSRKVVLDHTVHYGLNFDSFYFFIYLFIYLFICFSRVSIDALSTMTTMCHVPFQGFVLQSYPCGENTTRLRHTGRTH